MNTTNSGYTVEVPEHLQLAAQPQDIPTTLDILQGVLVFRNERLALCPIDYRSPDQKRIKFIRPLENGETVVLLGVLGTDVFRVHVR